MQITLHDYLLNTCITLMRFECTRAYAQVRHWIKDRKRPCINPHFRELSLACFHLDESLCSVMLDCVICLVLKKPVLFTFECCQAIQILNCD